MKIYVILILGSLFFNGAKFLYDFVLLHTLDAETYAVYGLLSLVSVYFNHLHFGLANGIAVSSVRYVNGPTQLTRGVRVGRAVVPLVTVVLITLAVIPTLLFWDKNKVAMLAAMTISIFLFNYVLGLSKMDLRFGRAASLQLVSGVCLLCGAGYLYYAANLTVAVVLLVTAFLVPLGLFRDSPHGWFLGDPSFSSRGLKVVLVRSFRVGWPIMLTGLTYAAMTSLDRLYINAYLPAEDFRDYSMGSLVLSGAHLIISVISSINYPKLTNLFFSKDGEVVADFYKMQVAYAACVGFLLCLFFLLGVYAGGSLFFNDEVIGIIYLGSVGIPGVSVINAVTLAYNTAGKQKLLIKRSYWCMAAYAVILLGITLNFRSLLLCAGVSAVFYLIFSVYLYAGSRVDLSEEFGSVGG